jgi:hypothetical protein
MVHREQLERYPGTLEELAGEVADLRYDALAAFLQALAARLTADANADEKRGRPRLATVLRGGRGRDRRRRSQHRGGLGDFLPAYVNPANQALQ